MKEMLGNNQDYCMQIVDTLILYWSFDSLVVLSIDSFFQVLQYSLQLIDLYKYNGCMNIRKIKHLLKKLWYYK